MWPDAAARLALANMARRTLRRDEITAALDSELVGEMLDPIRELERDDPRPVCPSRRVFETAFAPQMRRPIRGAHDGSSRVQAPVPPRPSAPGSPLVHSPKLTGAAPPNRASRATIAFLESDRPDAPRADDSYGDIGTARRPGGRAIGPPRKDSPGPERPRASAMAITGWPAELLTCFCSHLSPTIDSQDSSCSPDLSGLALERLRAVPGWRVGW